MSAERAGGRPAGNSIEIKVSSNRDNIKQLWQRGVPVEQVKQEIDEMHKVKNDVPFTNNGNGAILGDICTARRKSRRRLRNRYIHRRNR